MAKRGEPLPRSRKQARKWDYGLLPARQAQAQVAVRLRGLRAAHWPIVCHGRCGQWEADGPDRLRALRSPHHFGRRGCFERSRQRGNLLFILWRRKAREEGGRPWF